MSGPVQDQFATAFRELRSAVGVSIKFGATTITAIVTESPMSRELVEGGFQSEASFVARILLADLAAVPTLGSSVTYQGQAFKVARAAIQPNHPIGEFTLKPKNR